MSFEVSEVFHSIQGEGNLAGMPSTFIRLAKCNLACSWCDAAYTWKGRVEFQTMELDELVALVEHEHVVVTGGEPTYAEDFDVLIAELHRQGKHVTVETNGTIYRPQSAYLVDLWSVSPKFGSSGQSKLLAPTQILRYVHLPEKGHVQLKFVVDSEEDFRDALALLRDLRPPRYVPVFMQPNGLCHVAAVKVSGHTVATDTTPAEGREFQVPSDEELEEDENGAVTLAERVRFETPYLDRVRWLYERVVRADAEGELPVPVRAVPQSHKLAWGNKRGF